MKERPLYHMDELLLITQPGRYENIELVRVIKKTLLFLG